MCGKINDKVNDAYAFVYSLTLFVAPLVSSSLYQQVGMGQTFDITAMMMFSFALILLIFNCGPCFMAENIRFIDEFSKYQTQEEKELDDEDDEENEKGELSKK